jgi:hypothetical protein
MYIIRTMGSQWHLGHMHTVMIYRVHIEVIMKSAFTEMYHGAAGPLCWTRFCWHRSPQVKLNAVPHSPAENQTLSCQNINVTEGLLCCLWNSVKPRNGLQFETGDSCHTFPYHWCDQLSWPSRLICRLSMETHWLFSILLKGMGNACQLSVQNSLSSRFLSHEDFKIRIYRPMARPQVEDGGEGLQIWRVAVNILHKQSRTADNGWSSSLVVGRGANDSSP